MAASRAARGSSARGTRGTRSARGRLPSAQCGAPARRHREVAGLDLERVHHDLGRALLEVHDVLGDQEVGDGRRHVERDGQPDGSADYGRRRGRARRVSRRSRLTYSLVSPMSVRLRHSPSMARRLASRSSARPPYARASASRTSSEIVRPCRRQVLGGVDELIRPGRPAFSPS